MREFNHTKRFDPSDDLTKYTADDWREVSQKTLPREILVEYYKQVDWMFYATHTDISTLDLPQEILYYIHDDVMVGTDIRETFDKIL